VSLRVGAVLEHVLPGVVEERAGVPVVEERALRASRNHPACGGGFETALARLLNHRTEQPATTTMSPDKHTVVPDWMQEEIAAAPTFGP
jgi:hypothetical protein